MKIFLISLIILSSNLLMSQTDYDKAIISYKLTNYEEAIIYLNKFIKLNPKSRNAYYVRGLCYESIEDWDYAIKDFSEAIKIDSNYCEAYTDRGNCYDFKGYPERAIIDFSKSISINPEYADAYFNRGVAYTNIIMGVIDQYNHKYLGNAIQDYEMAISLNSSYEKDCRDILDKLKKYLK